MLLLTDDLARRASRRTTTTLAAWTALLVLALCGWLAQHPPTAGAHYAKSQFSVVIAPSSVPAGARATLTATITNSSYSRERLDSAELGAPGALALVSATVGAPGSATVAGSKVTLRGLWLAPDRSVVVTIVADAACGASSGSWTAAAREKGWWGHPGEPFALDAKKSALKTSTTGSCALRFAAQPANARVGDALSAVAYSPSGPPPAVEIVDGAGNRATSSTASVSLALVTTAGSGTLGGSTSVAAVAGLASFPGLTLSAPGVYALDASSAGLTGTRSATFKVDQVAVACNENARCSGSVSTGMTALDVTASPNAGIDAGTLLLSFNAGLQIDCAGYSEASPDTALIDLRGGSREKTATLRVSSGGGTLTATTSGHHPSQPKLDVCYGSPVPFTTKSGATAAVGASYDWNLDGTLDPVYVGLLPDCGSGYCKLPPPCIVSRWTSAGERLVTVRIPGGVADPAMRG